MNSFITAPVKVNTAAASHMASVATQYSTNGAMYPLMRILAGHTVEAHIYAPYNLCGITTEKQIRECFDLLPDADKKTYFSHGQLDLVIETFGSGRLAFCLDGGLNGETMDHLKTICKEL